MTSFEHMRLIDCYERGTMTEFEVLLRIIPIVSDSREAWLSLSKDWRNRITHAIQKAPQVAKNWDSMRIFHTGAWTSRGAYEESERRNHVLLVEYRRGVEALRDTMHAEPAG